MQHLTHKEIIKRLKRAEGHLRSTIAMIEEGRPCVELAQQLHAIESAIAKAKHELIHDHIDHCVSSVGRRDPRSTGMAIAEIKSLTKYL
jgi:DNA-binding FrmR family transcriptional regulator